MPVDALGCICLYPILIQLVVVESFSLQCAGLSLTTAWRSIQSRLILTGGKKGGRKEEKGKEKLREKGRCFGMIMGGRILGLKTKGLIRKISLSFCIGRTIIFSGTEFANVNTRPQIVQ